MRRAITSFLETVFALPGRQMKPSMAARSVLFLGLLVVLPASAVLGAVPNDPSNLAATVLSGTQIKLDWVDNSLNETSFRVERSTDGVQFTQLGTTGADLTSLVDDTVAPDVLYTYQVIAVGADGDSKPSNVITMYTFDSVTPPAPVVTSPPNGDQLDTANVKFQWAPVSDMSGVTYRIVVVDMGNGITLHDVSGITADNISLLLYDSAYEWYVYATDGAGHESVPSETSYCQIVAIDHMAPDTTVTAPNGGEVLEGGSTYAITWYALDQDFTSTPDLKIKIYFSYNNGSSWEQIASLSNNPGVFYWQVPNNVSCDETCLIWVTAENLAGMLGSDPSDFAFSIESTNSAPSVAELVFPAEGQAGLDTDLTFRWKACQDLDGDAVTYRVYYCTNPNFTECPPTTAGALGKSTALGTSTGLPGLLLIGALFAFPRSRRKTFTFLVLPVILIGGIVVGCSGGGGGGSASTVPAELSLRVSGLNAGTTYYWKVVADDGKGGIVESKVQSFTTK